MLCATLHIAHVTLAWQALFWQWTPDNRVSSVTAAPNSSDDSCGSGERDVNCIRMYVHIYTHAGCACMCWCRCHIHTTEVNLLNLAAL